MVCSSSSFASAASEGTVPVMSSVASGLARVGVCLYPSGDSSAFNRLDNDGTAPVMFSVSAASKSAPIVGTSDVTSSMFCDALNVNVPVRSAELGVPKRPTLARLFPGVCFPSLFNCALFGASCSSFATGDNEKSAASASSAGDGVVPPATFTVSADALNSKVSVRSRAGAVSTLASSTIEKPAGTSAFASYVSPLLSSSPSGSNSRTVSNTAGAANDTRRPSDCLCFFLFANAGDGAASAAALSPPSPEPSRLTAESRRPDRRLALDRVARPTDSPFSVSAGDVGVRPRRFKIYPREKKRNDPPSSSSSSSVHRSRRRTHKKTRTRAR